MYVILVLSFASSSYILDGSPLPHMWFANIVFQFVASLFNILLDFERFLILMQVQFIHFFPF